MYSIHLQFSDLQIGLKFQNYCHKAGIYCANLTNHSTASFHVTTDDLTFYERLRKFVIEHDFLDIV